MTSHTSWLWGTPPDEALRDVASALEGDVSLGNTSPEHREQVLAIGQRLSGGSDAS